MQWRPINKVSQQRNSETWWRRTIATLLSFSFGTYRRRRRDVLMEHQGYIPLRHRQLFHLRLVFLRRRSNGTSLLRPLDTPSTSLGVSFETYLRRCYDVQREVIKTSLRRLVAGLVKYTRLCCNCRRLLRWFLNQNCTMSICNFLFVARYFLFVFCNLFLLSFCR